MKNESDVKEWVRFADMDVLSANHLNEIQHGKPLEIICYHCQQASEKMLKALVLAFDGELQKNSRFGLAYRAVVGVYIDFRERIERRR